MLDNIHAGLFGGGEGSEYYRDGSSATSSSASDATGSNTNTDTTYDDEGTAAATTTICFTRATENTSYTTGIKSAPSRATRAAMTMTTASTTKGKALRFYDAETVYNPATRRTNNIKATPRTTNTKMYISSATRSVSQNDDYGTVRTNHTSGTRGTKFTMGTKYSTSTTSLRSPLRSASKSRGGSVVTFASDVRDDDDCTMPYTHTTRKSYYNDDDGDTATAYTDETDAGSSPWCMISHIIPQVVEDEENESATTFTAAAATSTVAASDADAADTVMHDEVDRNTNYNKSSSTKPTKKIIGVRKQMASSINATWIATKAKVATITPTSTTSAKMNRPNQNLVLVSSRGKTTRVVGRGKTYAVGLVDKARRELCTC